MVIRSQAPMDYTVTEEGKSIRHDVEQKIPKLQEKVDELQKLIPVVVKPEYEGDATSGDGVGIGDVEDSLTAIYAQMAKRKQAEAEENFNKKSKRIKTETF
jgi:hypothetical protein